ncbi:MAG: NADH-quinone oxidoreductase subunit L, partial [Cyclobacteriaceae bacterium]|nr:NADH-quinone oxidoreductase subunit L [Cyclobacteriaceae bacterium HetDA_MAG_MS6]
MSIELLMILAVSLPFIGGLIAYVLRGQAKRASIVATIGVASSFLFAILIIPIVTLQPVAIRFEWLSDFQVGWYVDRLSAALLALVGFISMLVHLFSSSYLQRDPGIGRYYFKLGFFTSSMLGLLIADHLLLLFVFWELVGFSSYLLIGFWYQEIKNARGSRIAFMTNRVADAGFLMGILIWLSYTGNGFMSEMEPLLQGSLWLSLAGLGLLVGALGKSAQFPFFTWLPHAMAGPTPASALIHAATMVAAGVYLLARVHMIFTPEVLSLTAIAGAVTAF